MDKVTASASQSDDGSILVTLNNVDPHTAASVALTIRGHEPRNISARVLTSGRMQDHNTFAEPEKVTPDAFTAINVKDSVLHFDAPPQSVVAITLL
jgi:alpha-N-arabinofuranosidase